jgi:hypothetical protein
MASWGAAFLRLAAHATMIIGSENFVVRFGLVAKPADYHWFSANAGSKAVVAG